MSVFRKHRKLTCATRIHDIPPGENARTDYNIGKEKGFADILLDRQKMINYDSFKMN